MNAFIDCLLTEAKHYQSLYPNTAIRSIYMGGGTPSMLSPTLLEKLFKGLRSIFDLSTLEELTFEANPATFTERKVQLFKDLGITRVSLGIQSFSDRVLSTLGREHSCQQAIDSVKLLQQVGMEEVNIDLMFAVPGQPLQEWQDTLDTAVSLKPDHISCYNLTYEEDTEFIKKLTEGEYVEDEELNARYFEVCHETLSKAGFRHYETSNYAQPGKESRHNKAYWLGNDYIGIGPSAVGTVNRTRYKNVPDTAKYIQMVNHVGHAQTEIEKLSDEAFRIERIALLLRTADGLPLQWTKDSDPSDVEFLIEQKLARLHNGHLQLINTGPMLVDSVAERLV